MSDDVGLAGFVCPLNGQPGPIDRCVRDCKNRCMSLPMLLALYGRGRDIVDKRYSVTEILNPPQIVYLSRHRSFYTSPQHAVWMIFGSAIHEVIEGGHAFLEKYGLLDRYIIEQKFEADVAGCTLVGKSDMYEPDTKTLWDFKSAKEYSVLLMKRGHWDDNTYATQLNIYRTYQYPLAEHLKIEAIVKDWTRRSKCAPIEDIDVPILDEACVREDVEARIGEHESAHETGVYRNCLDKEMWFNMNPRSPDFGVPLRCASYCAVSSICRQYKKLRGINEATEDGPAD